MEQSILTNLTDEELILEQKKRKQSYYTNAFIVGFLIGIAAYSTFRNGLGFLTFLPLVFITTATKSSQSYKAVKAEVQSRNNK